jgi:hypothetical protein
MEGLPPSARPDLDLPGPPSLLPFLPTSMSDISGSASTIPSAGTARPKSSDSCPAAACAPAAPSDPPVVAAASASSPSAVAAASAAASSTSAAASEAAASAVVPSASARPTGAPLPPPSSPTAPPPSGAACSRLRFLVSFDSWHTGAAAACCRLCWAGGACSRRRAPSE